MTIAPQAHAGPPIGAQHCDPINRVVKLETEIIQHAQLTAAKASIQKLHNRSHSTGKQRLKARALLLVGESGAGKTTILEDYFSEHPTSETVDGDIRPVVVVETPQRPTRRQFVAAIMSALGYKAKDDWNIKQIIDRISSYCEELNVGIMLIDEAQEIFENKSEETQREISEFLKSLLNSCKMQIVLAGLPSLMKLGEFKQLKRRLEPPVKLVPYNWSTVEGRVEFLAILSCFEENAGLSMPSNLADHETAKRIYCATGGHVGLVSKYLSHALEIALREGFPKIDCAVLARAFDAFEGEDEEIPLLDFDAPPVPAGNRERNPQNPFLATQKELAKLWSSMIENRGTMGRNVRPRASRQTRFHGAGDNKERML
jgi:type II secretory pathway predicted ATPase ExeA